MYLHIFTYVCVFVYMCKTLTFKYSLHLCETNVVDKNATRQSAKDIEKHSRRT